MAPPPITPSPHRFLTSESKPANTTPKPSSSLRFQQNATQSPSSQQFALAPLFNFNSTQKTANENATPATQFSSFLSRRPHLPPAFPVKNREDIEETSSDREDDELLQDNGASRFALSTQPTSKRRRPNPPEAEAEAIIISSDSPSPTSPPTTPLRPTIEEDDPSDPVSAPQFQTSTTSTTHPLPRFVLPLPKPTSDTTTPSIPSRPPLILPPRSPFPPPIALPAIFSPQRRGQKYVPGGLAATVRDWIIETGQVAHNQVQAHARRGGGSGEEVWDVKVRVAKCVVGDEGAGLVLVREMERDRERWMLVGRGRGNNEVEVGRVMGVREPLWDVEVGDEGERERWRVGVEWKGLDG